METDDAASMTNDNASKAKGGKGEDRATVGGARELEGVGGVGVSFLRVYGICWRPSWLLGGQVKISAVKVRCDSHPGFFLKKATEVVSGTPGEESLRVLRLLGLRAKEESIASSFGSFFMLSAENCHSIALGFSPVSIRFVARKYDLLTFFPNSGRACGIKTLYIVLFHNLAIDNVKMTRAITIKDRKNTNIFIFGHSY
jgi:hypothetical protein